MASILDRYGIKEVADVTFYELDANGKPTRPVLYLDTLKVSTIEQTAEQAEARGGKGNPPLIIWDYGKEINVTLEDALFSAKSMAIMFGNGQVREYASSEATASDRKYIMRTEEFIAEATSATIASIGWKANYEGPNGKLHAKVNPKYYDETGKVFNAESSTFDSTTQFSTFKKGDKYFCSYDLASVNAGVIEISAASFPGTYYVTGDTYARSEASGKDEFFQFIIPKAKMNAENTITLEVEGDPSVFNMSLRVMRPADGVMMKLVKYDLVEAGDAATPELTLIHNHTLVGSNKSDT